MARSACDQSFLVWPALGWFAVTALFMLLSALLYWPTPEVAFLSDNSPVSWLSSAQLWALAILSFRLAIDGSLPRSLGLWLSAAMVALAFDEQFMFHERWKYGCAQWLNMCRQHWVTELPTVLVGGSGAVTVLWMQRALPFRAARNLLWLALGVGGIAIQMDLTGWPAVLSRYEEALEVIAEALFTGVVLGLPAPRRNPA